MTTLPSLKNQIASGWVLSAGCFDAWSAKLAEHAGFTSLHFSGGAYHTSQYAYAGLTYTMSELVSQVGRITEAVSAPMLVDIDTGFGGIEDIIRTTRQVERIGAQGVHIEDLRYPIERIPGIPQEVIPLREAEGRVRAALSARSNSDFLIIGRSDSSTSINDLIERCNTYLAAGADVAFPILRGVEVEGKPLYQHSVAEKMKHYKRIVSEITGPVLTVGGIDREFSASQLQDCGFAWSILPLISFQAATSAMYSALAEARIDGLAAQYFQDQPNSLPSKDYLSLVDMKQVASNQAQFGAAH